MPHLDLKPEIALTQKKINGMILLCYEDERPLQRTIGEMDWRLNGAFTQLLKAQVLTGRPGETVYIPLLWNGNTFHFVVLGAGMLTDPKPSLESARKKMNELKLSQLAISKEDWSGVLDEEDPDLWILN